MRTNLRETKQLQEYLHGTSNRESIVMETSTLPSQFLLPIKFASLSPTLRREKTLKWNLILVTYFDKAFLNLSDRGHSSFSMLKYYPRYHGLQGPKLGANITRQDHIKAGPVPRAPASIISSVTEIVIVIIFAAYQGHLQGFFINPNLKKSSVIVHMI